jgi:hypothetical protein
MTEDELNALVESKLEDRLAARLQADRERMRAEVIAELRREEDRKWYDRVNRRHPIEGPLAGLTPSQHAARLKEMDARARADMEQMDRANARVPEGAAVRGARASLTPGSEGFQLKRGV